MKLLFDQNISRLLVEDVRPFFPGSTHVTQVALDKASDREVWDYAAGNGFAIVSKDADFHHLAFLLGAPPKTIWLRLGNCATADIRKCLIGNRHAIAGFEADPTASVLILGRS